jgi:RNA polymerase sigma-70 factor, ECF subfamily
VATDLPTQHDHSSEPAPQDRTEEFVALLARSEFEIHTYILTLLPNRADADDVLQRTSVILWRKFSSWQRGTDFAAWACQTARFEVKNFLRSRARDRLYFDDELIDSLGDVRNEMAEDFSGRRDALHSCLEKLGSRDRQIIEGCYTEKNTTAKEVAAQLGRPVNTVYKALIRIRRALFECVERTLAGEGRV